MNRKLADKIHFEETEGYNKVINWFFSFPSKETSLSDLSMNLKISKTTANRVIEQLIKEGFLSKEVLGRVWRISCNKSHPYFYTRKISQNLRWVYESGVMDKIHEIEPNPKATILFGSYRKGDDLEESDIDIAVELPGNRESKIISLGVVKQIGYRKNVQVNLYIFSRDKIDLNLFANIANGIVIEGFLEVRP